MDTVINVLCPMCHGPDTTRIEGGNPDAENALYGCKECLHTFVTRKVVGTAVWSPKDAYNAPLPRP